MVSSFFCVIFVIVGDLSVELTRGSFLSHSHSQLPWWVWQPGPSTESTQQHHPGVL